MYFIQIDKLTFIFLIPAGLVDIDLYRRECSNPKSYLDSIYKAGLDPYTTNEDEIIERLGIDILHAHRMLNNVLNDSVKQEDGCEVSQASSDMREYFDRLNRFRPRSASRNVLVFDQCAHLGVTLRVTKQALEEAFPDRTFFTGVTEFETGLTEFRPDFIALQPEYFEPIGCRLLFGKYFNASTIGKLATDPNVIRDQESEGALFRNGVRAICDKVVSFID